MPRTISKIFLDASAVIAALGSEQGGSFLIVSHQGSRYRCLISEDILVEVFSKKEKLALTKQKIEEWIKTNNILVTRSPTEKDKNKISGVVEDDNDRHVLASSQNNRVDILLSYDRKHIITKRVINHMKPIKVMTPKQFLQKRPL